MTDIEDRKAEPEGDLSASASREQRGIRNGIIGLAIFTALVVALLLAVPSLRHAVERVTDAGMPYVVAAVGLKLASCAGYVVFFILVFQDIELRFAMRVALSELAVNSLVSVSGLAGVALGAWVLRSRGLEPEDIGRRSTVTWVLTSAVNVAAVFVIGIPMWLGLIGGTRNPLLTALPAFAALAVILIVLGLAFWARKFGAGGEGAHRVRRWVGIIGEGVFDTLQILRGGDVRLLGAVGYWLFDNMVLWATLAAVGVSTSFWIVAMAYLVGMLGNSLPIPGGLVAVEGGLVGMLLLYDVRPASAVVAAVIIYRAIALWIPALIGTIAFGRLRREIPTAQVEQPA
jgi:uncharacterized membrane protein YbhN (UPF0104 family)